MDSNLLRQRCKAFSLSIIRLVRKFPNTIEALIVGKQLLRSAVSVTANYHAACRARSREEFVSKLSIVVEEADETVLWLEMANDSEIMTIEGELLNESREILYIMSSSRKSAKVNLAKIKKSANQQINK